MILKFGTKLDSDKLYWVTKKKQPHIAYQSLYLFIFYVYTPGTKYIGGI